MKKNYLWFIVAVLYCIAIFLTTAAPVSTGANSLQIIAQLFHLSDKQASIINFVFRKSVHLIAFGVLAMLFYHSFTKRRFLKAWLVTTLYGATDEWHQAFTPERTGAFGDVIIDSIGAFVALIILVKIKGRSKQRVHNY